jgi:mannonate dehydratase
MDDLLPRRTFFQAAGAFAVAPALAAAQPAAAAAASTASRDWPLAEGPDTPKLCLGVDSAADEKEMRGVRQIGVERVLMGGPATLPWKEADLRALVERFKAGGLTVANLMIAGFSKALYGRPGRDDEIAAVVESIRAAGAAGIPVVEYNFYAHRLVEGYYEEPGRAGAGLTAYDYERSKNLPPLPDEGAHSLDEMWANVTYFLKAVVPAAEKAGVRLALHPNDPPVPLSRGSGQIMATLAGWKRLMTIVDSPANGITYDCGVTREMAEDPVEVCRWFGERDRINHVHYRNVRVRRASVDYTEVFLDEGEVDMFAVMRELVRLKYPRALYPEHERALDADRERPGFRPYYPGGGGYAGRVYNVAYTKAMLQAALSV